jgi:NAD(P)-dependent dehydrogenase (short-subunit alcohol dehydrogenase family)
VKQMIEDDEIDNNHNHKSNSITLSLAGPPTGFVVVLDEGVDLLCVIFSTVMSKIAVIAGWGPGVGDAVVRAFSKEGFSFALLSKSPEKLIPRKVSCRGYAVDLAEFKEVASIVTKIHEEMGAIEMLVWNALMPMAKIASVVKGSPEAFANELKLGVGGLQAITQAALEDLKSTKGSILLSGGGLADDSDFFNDIAASGLASLAVNKAAQRKWIAVAHRELKEFGIFVAEINIANTVRGTQFDPKGASALGP